jgi:hypothetical protein
VPLLLASALRNARISVIRVCSIIEIDNLKIAVVLLDQRARYRTSKQDKEARFYSLYDKVCRADVLWEAWRQVKAHQGAPVVDGKAIEAIVKTGQEEALMGFFAQPPSCPAWDEGGCAKTPV